MAGFYDDGWESLKEWYSIHVRTGLPAQIARGANQLHISPGEFLERVVERGLAELNETAASPPPPSLEYCDSELELVGA